MGDSQVKGARASRPSMTFIGGLMQTNLGREQPV